MSSQSFGEERLRGFFGAGVAAGASSTPSALAADLVGSFTDAQKEIGALALDDPQRLRWYASPTLQSGLTLNDLRAEQQRLVHRLMRSCLSESGYNLVALVMGFENILDQSEDWNQGTMFEDYPGIFSHRRGRDPNMFFTTIFGTPGPGMWGWRVGGHHLALNFTLRGDAVVSGTPFFVGNNPAAIPLPGGQVLRLQGPEQELARAVMAELDDSHRAAATISPVPPWDVTQQGLPEVTDGAEMNPRLFFGFEIPEAEHRILEGAIDAAMSKLGWSEQAAEGIRYSVEPKGLAVREMPPAAQAHVAALVDQYLERFAPGQVPADWSELPQQISDLHFAWAGTGPGPHMYFRLQGPTFLVEYTCTQSGGNHGHSLLRSPANDFGARDLREADTTPASC